MFCLFVGRGYDIGVERLSVFANDSFLQASYWVLCLAVIIPIQFVMIGIRIRESAYSKIDHDRTEMEKFMQYFGSKAKVNEDEHGDETEFIGE